MNLSKKILAYIKIIRPLNAVIIFFVVVVSILISQKESTDKILIFLTALAALLTASAGNIINDIFDIETDRISHPNRVLVQGTLTKNNAIIAYVILNIISIIISFYLSITLLLIVVTSIIILFYYSYIFKKKPLIGNILVALLTGLAFIYGGFAVNNPYSAIVPAVFAFLINLIRELVKDVQDIKGDSKLNYKTFPIIFGVEKSRQLITMIIILLFIFTFYPFLIQYYKIEYFVLVMIFVNPILIICLKFILNITNKKKLSAISKLLKINMVFGLIAIYFGK